MKRSTLVNRSNNVKTIVEDAVSYVQNYTEETAQGVFKVSKATIGISSTSIPIVQTNTIFMSHDVGTAKQIIEFTQRDEPIDFRKTTEVIIAYEFPDIDVGERVISYKVKDKNKDRSSIEFILERVVLDVGTTRVNQYIYLLFDDGTSIDVGIVVFNLNRSFIDSNIDNIEEFYIRKLEDVKEYLLYRANEIIARLLQLEGEFHDLDFEQLATRRQLEEAVNKINNEMRAQKEDILYKLNNKVDKTFIESNMPTKISIDNEELRLESNEKVLSHVDIMTEDLVDDMLNYIFMKGDDE